MSYLAVVVVVGLVIAIHEVTTCWPRNGAGFRSRDSRSGLGQSWSDSGIEGQRIGSAGIPLGGYASTDAP